MKKTAILLFDLFSNYELSVAVSVLSQAGKPVDVFCLNDVAVSEEGLQVKRTKALPEADAAEYDSLLLPGCMDLRDILDDSRIHDFIRRFSLASHVIASISSSPLLLLKAGVLEDKRYVAGVMKQELLNIGFTMEQMRGMRDITELDNEDGTVTACMTDGNLLTAIGPGFVNFGVEFGRMLGLDFDPRWYGVARETVSP